MHSSVFARSPLSCCQTWSLTDECWELVTACCCLGPHIKGLSRVLLSYPAGKWLRRSEETEATAKLPPTPWLISMFYAPIRAILQPVLHPGHGCRCAWIGAHLASFILMKIASWVLTLMSPISYCDTGQFCIFSSVMNDLNQFASASGELLFRHSDNKLCSLNTSEEISRQLCIQKHVSRSNTTLGPCTRTLIVDPITFNIRKKKRTFTRSAATRFLHLLVRLVFSKYNNF